MSELISLERLAEILWDARKRTLGYEPDLYPLAEQDEPRREQYARFAAEVAALLNDDLKAPVAGLHHPVRRLEGSADGSDEPVEYLVCAHCTALLEAHMPVDGPVAQEPWPCRTAVASGVDRPWKRRWGTREATPSAALDGDAGEETDRG